MVYSSRHYSYGLWSHILSFVSDRKSHETKSPEKAAALDSVLWVRMNENQPFVTILDQES